ncbi:hypothetical protein BT69DRAFT_150946 [Atractiella rhizophila]|nr:hypothetical protein BT69DRAFT_150946 [Atractiella rhizophila]
MPHSGQCLCGKVTVKLDSTHAEQIICHCTSCQSFGGTAFSTNIVAQQKDVHITGETKKTITKSLSGNDVTYTSCANCGTPITHYSPVFGEGIIVQTGIFRDFKDIPVTTELFTTRRWKSIKQIDGAAQFPEMLG